MADLQNDAKSQSTGPIQEFGKAVADFFKSLSTPFLISGIVVIVGLIIGAILGLSKAGQKAINKGANKLSEVPLAALAV